MERCRKCPLCEVATCKECDVCLKKEKGDYSLKKKCRAQVCDKGYVRGCPACTGRKNQKSCSRGYKTPVPVKGTGCDEINIL